MKSHHSHSIFDPNGPEFWIVCSFLVMCLFIYRVVWPVIYRGLADQVHALQQKFAELAKRKANAIAHKTAIEEKHRTVKEALAQQAEENAELIDEMRTKHASQREAWQKHMVQAMDRTIDRESRKQAKAQANALIDEIIEKLGDNAKDTKAFREAYTEHTLGELDNVLASSKEK